MIIANKDQVVQAYGLKILHQKAREEFERKDDKRSDYNHSLFVDALEGVLSDLFIPDLDSLFPSPSIHCLKDLW